MIQAFFEQLDVWLLKTFAFSGLSEDKLKLLLYFYSTIFLGLLFRQIRSPNARRFTNLFLGYFFVMYLGMEWTRYITVTILLAYALVYLFRRKSFWPVFIVSFLALSWVHIYRQLYDYLSWKMDFNTIQMLATCRMLYYSHQYSSKKFESLNFIDYVGYVFMYPNLIVGPIPYTDFINFIKLQGEYADIKYTHKYWTMNLTKAILFSLGELLIRPYYDMDKFGGEEWEQSTLPRKYAILWLVSVFARFRYFCAFKYTQAAIDSLGIGYNGETDKGPRFDRYSVADYHYELEPNSITKTSQWNSLVQVWLKDCIYDRLRAEKVNQSIAYYITFVVSAIWHGFYPVYYFLFFWWAMINQICKYFYKAKDKFKIIPAPIRYVIAHFTISEMINQCAVNVALLDWNKAMKFNADFMWTTQIAIAAIFSFFYVTQFGQPKSEKRQKKQE